MAIRIESGSPDLIKGRGNAQRRGVTYRNLEELKEFTEAEFERAGKPKSWDPPFACIGLWENGSTAAGVARGITHANTIRAKSTDQKTPGGFWIAGVKVVPGGTEVWAKYLGQHLTSAHPMHGKKD